MIYLYKVQKNYLIKKVWKNTLTSLDNVIWIDAYNVSMEEKKFLEKKFDIEVPSLEEIGEIEVSRRFTYENYIYYLTVNVIGQAENDPHHIKSIAFYLTTSYLMTIRYFSPYALSIFEKELLESFIKEEITCEGVFMRLLNSIVYHLADTLEKAGITMDRLTKLIFMPSGANSKAKLDLQRMLQQIGLCGDITSKTGESMVSFYRLISYVLQSSSLRFHEDDHLQLTTLSRDITALREHSSFLANKVNFLLDATLGLINIEQSAIIKIFSVAAVIFLPPTLIASIYGMNFKFMPELNWKYGYLMALSMMILSAWLPYVYFKRKKWL